MGSLTRPPANSALTYAVSHLVVRDEPWILDLPCEHIVNTLGGYWHFQRYRSLVTRLLLRENCRKIIVRMSACKTAIEAVFGDLLSHKVEVVYWGVPGRVFVRPPKGSEVTLLFVNSVNVPGQFLLKGGLDALDAFLQLKGNFPGLRMAVRSDIPAWVRRRYGRVEGLTFIEEPLPWAKVEELFLTADVFVLPTRLTPSAVFFDAMSYGLPIVTTDAWGNGEIVRHGETGILVHEDTLAAHYHRYLPRYFVPPPGSPEHQDLVGQPNPRVVDQLVQGLTGLIEDPERRRQMGEAGRKAAERGPFSLDSRNRRLAGILGEALRS